MKKLIVVFIIGSLTAVHAQRKPKIKGNRNVIELSEDLPAFNAIELNDDIDIVLQKGTTEGYRLTADDNLVDVLKFRVADSTLMISSFYRITAKKKLDITIIYYELNSIELREGRIKMQDKVSSDMLSVRTSGNAKLQLNANASVIDVVMNGNSSGDFNLESDSLNMVLKDRIDVSIYAVTESNVINLQDNAAAKMDGTTFDLTVNQSGNTNLKAQKLQADLVVANLEGSATSKVFAQNTFILSSRGSSKAYLSGEPKIEIRDFLDTSELHKEK